jgi:hypothetical protein
MVYSFGDFNYKKKIEEIYEGFSDLLIKSDLIKNKDFPFIDFEDLLRGYDFLVCLRKEKEEMIKRAKEDMENKMM